MFETKTRRIVFVVVFILVYIGLLIWIGIRKGQRFEREEDRKLREKAAIELAEHLEDSGSRAIVTSLPYLVWKSTETLAEARKLGLQIGDVKVYVVVQGIYAEDHARSVYCDPEEDLEKGDIVSLHRVSGFSLPPGSILVKKVASSREFHVPFSLPANPR